MQTNLKRFLNHLASALFYERHPIPVALPWAAPKISWLKWIIPCLSIGLLFLLPNKGWGQACDPAALGLNSCTTFVLTAASSPALIPGGTISGMLGNGASCNGDVDGAFFEATTPSGTTCTNLNLSGSNQQYSAFIPLDATSVSIIICRFTGGNPNLCGLTVLPCAATVTTCPAPATLTCAQADAFANDPAGLFAFLGGVITASSANCGTLVISDNFNPALPCGGISSVTFSATFTPTGGTPQVVNFSSCTQPVSVTVSAAAAPTFTAPLPMNITVSCGGIPAASSLAYTNGLAAPCLIAGNVTSTQTAPPGACGGTVTETWTILSANNCGRGNIVHSRTITVSAATAPAFTAPPGNITVSVCGTVPATSSLAYTNGLAAPCTISGSVTSTQTTAPGACGGSVTETWTIPSASNCNRGNIVHTRTITVTAPTAPVFANCGQTINLGCAPTALPTCATMSLAAFGGAVTASNQCGPVTVTCNPGPVVNLTACNRRQVFTFTAMACGLTSTCTRTFNWTAPTTVTVNNCGQTINLGCNPSVLPTCANMSLAAFGGAVTANNACGPVTVTCSAGATTSNGCNRQRIITFTITACGHTSTCTRTFTWRLDFAKPTFVAPPNLSVECTAPIPPVVDPVAMDGCGGAVTVMYLGEVCTYFNCSVNRQLKRTWKATDVCGNTTLTTQLITISDTQAPVFNTVPPSVTLECSDLFPALPALPTATDACCSYVQVSYNGQTTVLGTCPQNYVVTRKWTATDECGNSRTTVQIITVQDTRRPDFINPPANVTIGCSSPVPEPPVIMVMDNCDQYVPLVYLGETTAGGPGCPRIITRTWTATDDCGNSRSHVQTITVNAVLKGSDTTEDRGFVQGEQQVSGNWQLKALLTPNPAQDEVWVSFEAAAESEATLALFDVGGRLILQQSVTAFAGNNRFRMDLTGLTGGFCTVEVRVGGQRTVERLVIVK